MQAESLEQRLLLSNYNFNSIASIIPAPNGQTPYAGVAIDSSGNLFGTTESGGLYNDGTVFEVVHGATAITTIATFNGANGANPYGGITLDTGGNLFGTTYAGGANANGTVFEIAHGTTAINTLDSLDSSDARPYASVTLDASGDIFGTSYTGGTAGVGAVFEIVHGTSVATVLASFNTANSATPNPMAPLTLDANGDLFGTTEYGGTKRDGTVFEIVHGTSAIADVASFNGSNGSAIVGGVTLDSNGDLFGDASTGGANGDGSVFEILNGNSTITTIGNFNIINGIDPLGTPTLDSNGNLFGSTFSGFAGAGTVFEIARGTTVITTLGSFNTVNGSEPRGAMAIDSQGNLFGATTQGGNSGIGAIFEVAHGATTVSAVASFNVANGADLLGNVTIDGNGNLLGTAKIGGTSGYGTVFEIASGGSVINAIASFNGPNGLNPWSGLTMDSAGNFFGTTWLGGINGRGTVFEFAHGATAITTVASFNGSNGANPQSALIIDSSGNLFGLAPISTGDLNASLFEIVRGSTVIKTLASFNSTLQQSSDGLTLDSLGDIIGTTYGGGASGDGTVFELASGSSTITTLVSFNGANGQSPNGAPTLDSNGNIFGTTQFGGASLGGTVFEIVKGSNTVTTIAAFNSTGGSWPEAGVTLDANGDIFGTTDIGGASSLGTVFEIVQGSGVISTLETFNGVNGNGPQAALTLDTNGNLFGTTSGGGIANSGTVFELSPTGTASGEVFNDVNNNGALDSGEIGQAGVSVTLTPTGATSGSPVSVVTGADGHYSFVNVNPGSYSVSETLPIGFALTAPIGSSGPVTVTSGLGTDGPVFGNVQISSITLNFNTLVALSQDYLHSGTFASGDLNGDGTVNFDDLVLLSQNYNQTLPINDYASSIAPAIAGLPALTKSTVAAAVMDPAPAATVQRPISKQTPVLVIKPTVPAFTITSTRVTDPLDHTKDIVTFYARNNGAGAIAGTRDVSAIDATLSSPSGLFIRTYDADGSGLLDDADFAGENAMPTASYIRLGGPGFFVVPAGPSATTDKYKDMQLVPSFEVAGVVFGGTVANSASGTRIAVAVVKKGAAVRLTGQLAAEMGKLFGFASTNS